MKTDDLIEALSRNLEPAPRPPGAARFFLVALGGLVLGLGLLLAVPSIGVRPDIGVAIEPVLLKAGFAALATSMATPLLLRLARPGRPAAWRIGALVGFLALAVLIGVVSLMGVAPERRMTMWTGGGFPWCIVLIPLLAIPAAGVLGMFVRGQAPTNLTAAGASVGAVAGGIGAISYAMYCPVDSVPFVATWYALAIALCAAIGALVGSRLLRW